MTAKLKVYVAGNPKTHRDAIRSFMDWVKEQPNLELSYDWLEAYESNREGDRFLAAVSDLQGVEDCHVLVLFDAKMGWGMYTEMGAALGLDKEVIVVDPVYKQIFFELTDTVPDAEAAKRSLEDLYHTATFPL